MENNNNVQLAADDDLNIEEVVVESDATQAATITCFDVFISHNKQQANVVVRLKGQKHS